MKIYVLSRDRWDYSPTMSTLPKIVRQQMTVMVPPDQYKQYKKSQLFADCKHIVAWPSYVDCVPKKRRFLYEKVKDDHMVVDDDLGFLLWNGERFVPATDHPKVALKRFERMFDMLDTRTMVGGASTFMTSKRIKEQGTTIFEHNAPFCCVAYAKNRPKLKWYPFFYTDVSMPLQLSAVHRKNICTYAGLAFNFRTNQKLLTTGTSTYRDHDITLFSAISLAQLVPGHVFDLKKSNNKTGGVAMYKSFTTRNDKRSDAFVTKFLAEHGLQRLPELVDLDLRTPRAELFEQYRQSWADAGLKIKSKKGKS